MLGNDDWWATLWSAIGYDWLRRPDDNHKRPIATGSGPGLPHHSKVLTLQAQGNAGTDAITRQASPARTARKYAPRGASSRCLRLTPVRHQASLTVGEAVRGKAFIARTASHGIRHTKVFADTLVQSTARMASGWIASASRVPNRREGSDKARPHHLKADPL